MAGTRYPDASSEQFVIVTYELVYPLVSPCNSPERTSRERVFDTSTPDSRCNPFTPPAATPFVAEPEAEKWRNVISADASTANPFPLAPRVSTPSSHTSSAWFTTTASGVFATSRNDTSRTSTPCTFHSRTPAPVQTVGAAAFVLPWSTTGAAAVPPSV